MTSIRGFIKFLCRRSVGVFSRAFLVFLMKESKKRRRKQPGKLIAKSRSQPVNLPGARPLKGHYHAYSWRENTYKSKSMPFWPICCESNAILFKKFRPGDRAGVFIWENFRPGYRDLRTHRYSRKPSQPSWPGSYEEALTRSTIQGKRLVFRVKRQIKTVLTSVVVEHVKSRTSNVKTRQR